MTCIPSFRFVVPFFHFLFSLSSYFFPFLILGESFRCRGSRSQVEAVLFFDLKVRPFFLTFSGVFSPSTGAKFWMQTPLLEPSPRGKQTPFP